MDPEELEAWSSKALTESFEARPAPQFRGHLCFLVHRRKGIVSLDLKSDSITSVPDAVTASKRPDQDDPITSFCVDKDDGEMHVVTAHKSSLLRTWVKRSLDFASSYKSTHKGPVVMMAMSIKNDVLLTISVERTITATLWAIKKPICLRTVRGVVPTQATSVLILPTGSVAIGSVEGSIAFIKCDGAKNEEHTRFAESALLLKKHVSAVTFMVATNNNGLLSTGKDGIMVLWGTLQYSALKVVPVYEDILSALFVRNEGIVADMDTDANLMLTGGSKGRLRLWDVQNATVHEILNEGEEMTNNAFLRDVFDTVPISQLHKGEDNQILVLQDDLLLELNLNAKKTKTLSSLNWSPIRQMDVLQSKIIVLAVSDSSLLRFFDVESGKLLKVHQTTHPELVILSAADDKDETKKMKLATYGSNEEVKIWRISNTLKKLVPLVSLPKQAHMGMLALTKSHLVTMSNEGVLASRRILNETQKSAELASPVSVLSHTERVNTMDVHNDKVVTGSQDGTAKVFNIDSLALLNTLSGHKRGVERIAFSSFDDDIFVTGSGDGRLRVWSYPGMTCQRTLDHVFGANCESYVFVKDKKLVVGDDQGAFSVWDLANGNEPSVCTRGHEDASLSFVANVMDEKLVTAGSDNELRLWSSNEALIEQLRTEKIQKRTLEEQKLMNLTVKGDTKNAALLAVRMGKVRTAFDLLWKAHQQECLQDALQEMNNDELRRLARCSVNWNANTKYYQLAQLIVEFCLKQTDEEDHVFDKGDVVRLMSYNERHLERLNRLDSRLAVLDCLVDQM